MPEFYGAEQIIKSVLEKSGDEVIWINNKIFPFDYRNPYSKLKLLRRIYIFLFSPQARYVKRELAKIDDLRFDILFSINCHIICPSLFRILKSKNQDLYSVLYLWDSFSKFSCKKDLLLFNRIFTFDRSDSEKYNIEYKPNFYLPVQDNHKFPIENDLYFLGKFSHERLYVIDKIILQAENAGIRYSISLWPAFKNLLHNHFVYYLLKLTNLNSKWIKDYIVNYEAVEMILKRDYISECSVAIETAQSILAQSNVILDLPFEGQSGFTHRVIDALAQGKKVITSNLKIQDELFYNPHQIHLLDLNNPVIDCAWVKEKKDFPEHSFFKDIELSSWLNSLINGRIA